MLALQVRVWGTLAEGGEARQVSAPASLPVAEAAASLAHSPHPESMQARKLTAEERHLRDWVD